MASKRDSQTTNRGNPLEGYQNYDKTQFAQDLLNGKISPYSKEAHQFAQQILNDQAASPASQKFAQDLLSGKLSSPPLKSAQDIAKEEPPPKTGSKTLAKGTAIDTSKLVPPPTGFPSSLFRKPPTGKDILVGDISIDPNQPLPPETQRQLLERYQNDLLAGQEALAHQKNIPAPVAHDIVALDTAFDLLKKRGHWDPKLEQQLYKDNQTALAPLKPTALSPEEQQQLMTDAAHNVLEASKIAAQGKTIPEPLRLELVKNEIKISDLRAHGGLDLNVEEQVIKQLEVDQAPLLTTPAIAAPSPPSGAVQVPPSREQLAAQPKMAFAVPKEVRSLIRKPFDAARHEVSKQAQSEVKKLAEKRTKSAAQKAVGKATKSTLMKLGSKALAIASGVGAAVLTAVGITRFLWKHKELVLAALSWLMLQLAALINLIIGSVFVLTGAVVGFVIAGPIGAVVGGAAGYALQSWLRTLGHGSTAQGLGIATKHLAGQTTAIVDATTGQVVTVVDSGIGGILSGATIVPASLVALPVFAALGTAGFMTFFVMMHILVAFTVPNPLGTTFQYPTGPNVPPGSVVPNPAQPNSQQLLDIMESAANKACIPSALLSAIMQTEGGGSFNWSDAQVTRFGGSVRWWENALLSNGTRGNCYLTHDASSTSECGRGQGYCFDACTDSGLCSGQDEYVAVYGWPSGNCSSLSGQPCKSVPSAQICPLRKTRQCTLYDVYGITQFRRVTFHGGSCTDREGLQGEPPRYGSPPASIQCLQGIASRIGITNHGPPNRCHAGDAIQATSFFIQDRAQISCPFDPTQWKIGNICAVARSYCGSCGTVADPNSSNYVTAQMYQQYPELYPCYPYYGNPGSNPEGCTSGNEGYCDKIYRLYIGSGSP